MLTKKELSLYWKCQLCGWTLTGIFWSFQAYFDGGFRVNIAVIHLLLDIVIGIGITHSYRAYIKRNGLLDQPVFNILRKTILCLLLMAITYTGLVTIKNYSIRSHFNSGYDISLLTYFSTNGAILLITGARLLAIWVLIYHLYHYAMREIKITQDHARLTVMAKEAQLAKLQAQLNPHFLFNSLNTIKSLVVEEPRAARRGIDLLSELLRSSLYGGNEHLVSIKAELALVRDYLELETLRFGERLRYQIETDEQAEMLLIPLLSIQGLVENAVKHGIDHEKDGGLIVITVRQVDQKVEIMVCNTGKLMDSGSQNGIGLVNLHERLKMHFNGLAQFQLVEDNGNVTATLTLPQHA